LPIKIASLSSILEQIKGVINNSGNIKNNISSYADPLFNEPPPIYLFAKSITVAYF
jgi:hypothetical protein